MRKYPSFITNKLEIVYAINSLHITLVNFKGNNIYIYNIPCANDTSQNTYET